MDRMGTGLSLASVMAAAALALLGGWGQPPTKTSTGGSEFLYRGEPYSVWRGRVRRELDEAALKESILAVASLGQKGREIEAAIDLLESQNSLPQFTQGALKELGPSITPTLRQYAADTSRPWKVRRAALDQLVLRSEALEDCWPILIEALVRGQVTEQNVPELAEWLSKNPAQGAELGTALEIADVPAQRQIVRWIGKLSLRSLTPLLVSRLHSTDAELRQACVEALVDLKLFAALMGRGDPASDDLSTYGVTQQTLCDPRLAPVWRSGLNALRHTVAYSTMTNSDGTSRQTDGPTQIQHLDDFCRQLPNDR